MRLTGTGPLFASDTAYKTYCVARDGADQRMLQAALDWTCSQGKIDCSSMFQGQPCYEPNTVAAHASVAFNMYCYMNGLGPENCNFKGVASITTTDPSHDTCFMDGELTNGTTIPDDSLGSALDPNVLSSAALLFARARDSMEKLKTESHFPFLRSCGCQMCEHSDRNLWSLMPFIGKQKKLLHNWVLTCFSSAVIQSKWKILSWKLRSSTASTALRLGAAAFNYADLAQGCGKKNYSIQRVSKNLGKTLSTFQPMIRGVQEVSREFKSMLDRELDLDCLLSSA
ncbi:hypothetical protein MKW98_005615 [Papaver atlanticum]|uniref:X8 domain-containing protein n=1 Tax=Papaver atlanticum TaxID=357466 RepID=A0AAD4XJW8_9MAGN|nr:hypothetical protein MKW98_005615 [Papaver atlanticum]